MSLQDQQALMLGKGQEVCIGVVAWKKYTASP